MFFQFYITSSTYSLCSFDLAGGTDIISCFMGQNFSVPVYRGEVQANNLGMAMSCFNEDGEMVYDEPGELVCLSPFPCMPTHFWNDHNGELYNKAYFQKFPGRFLIRSSYYTCSFRILLYWVGYYNYTLQLGCFECVS